MTVEWSRSNSSCRTPIGKSEHSSIDCDERLAVQGSKRRLDERSMGIDDIDQAGSPCTVTGGLKINSFAGQRFDRPA